ncbi:MAG TPA: DUF3037 domain-containing protein [Bryobacteraceae bacterium]|jgi:hypothetical protein
MSNSFDYAIIRVVPFPEREEFFNAGVILFCPQRKFLDARVAIDTRKLKALAPQLETEEVRQRLDSIVKICAGDPSAGPIAQLSQRARFHWLVAPRSTMIQTSAVHAGICEDPAPVLERLFREQVMQANS